MVQFKNNWCNWCNSYIIGAIGAIDGESHAIHLSRQRVQISRIQISHSEYIEELMRENKRTHFDEEVIHADIDIFSKILLKNVFQKIDTNRLISEKLITHSSVKL